MAIKHPLISYFTPSDLWTLAYTGIAAVLSIRFYPELNDYPKILYPVRPKMAPVFVTAAEYPAMIVRHFRKTGNEQ